MLTDRVSRIGQTIRTGSRSTQSPPKLGRRFPVAEQAERAQVIEVALAATLRDCADVVSIPQAAAARNRLHPIQPQTGNPGRTASALQGVIGSDRIDLANRADTAITRKHLVAKIPGVGAQTPLMHAVLATEGPATLRQNLKIAPPAKRQPVRPLRKRSSRRTTAGKGARYRHRLHRLELIDQASKSTSSGSISGISHTSNFWWTGWLL